MAFDRTSGSRVWTRIGVFGIIAGSLVVSGIIWGLPDIDQLRDEVAQAGAWAPWVSILLFAAVSLGPVPKNALATTTGLLFGMQVGVLIVVTGALLSAMSAFVLARTLAREAVARLCGPTWTRFESRIRRHGLVTVIVARLSPVVPFTVFNYTAGITSIEARTFFIGTAVGIVPGSVAYVALGSYGGSPSSWSLAALMMLAMILLLVPGGRALIRHRGHQRSFDAGHQPTNSQSDECSATNPPRSTLLAAGKKPHITAALRLAAGSGPCSDSSSESVQSDPLAIDLGPREDAKVTELLVLVHPPGHAHRSTAH